MLSEISYALVVIVGVLLLVFGLIGIVRTSQNILMVLMCMELMTCGMTLVFISLSLWNQDPTGQIFAFFLITVAAAEAGVGLGLVVLTDNVCNSIDHQKLKRLRG